MADIISRDTYRRLKKYNREELNTWIHKFGLVIYNNGCRDAAAAEILALRDEFGFGTSRIARFMAKRDNTITAINERYITVEEILEGLREEGLKIKTDFEGEIEDADKG